MTMDEFEILTSYRQAANPEKQILVLAQLNACGMDRIIGILEAHGEKIDKRRLPRKRNPAETAKPKTTLTENASPAEGASARPESVFLTLGHLRRLCADMDDDVVIQYDGALFTGLRFVSLYNASSDTVQKTLDLVGDTSG